MFVVAVTSMCPVLLYTWKKGAKVSLVLLSSFALWIFPRGYVQQNGHAELLTTNVHVDDCAQIVQKVISWCALLDIQVSSENPSGRCLRTQRSQKYVLPPHE